MQLAIALGNRDLRFLFAYSFFLSSDTFIDQPVSGGLVVDSRLPPRGSNFPRTM